MLENIFYRKDIRELEDQLGIPHEVGRKIRRGLAIRLPFIAIRSVIGGLADAERARSWIGPEGMPVYASLEGSATSSATPFDPDKFGEAVRAVLERLPEKTTEE